jgi:outer membrane lipoprotein carrier protein
MQNTKNRFFSLVSASLCLCASLSISDAHAGAIDKLHSFFETTRSMRADFAQIVVAKNGKRPQQSTGVMMFSRPGKFRWQIDRPYSQLLVGDGKKIWIYDPDLRQVTVRKFDAALGSSPVALLVGEGDGKSSDKGALERNFTLHEAGEREGLEWLEAIPKSADSGFEKLLLGFSGNDLKSMELFDNFGQVTSLFFSNLDRNPQLSPALFRFTPPAGVDVLGE